MRFVSTRSAFPTVSLSQAIAAGLAADGGLYLPQTWPAQVNLRPGHTLAETANVLLQPFFAGDKLETELPAICHYAFNFPAPLRPLATDNDYVLELFHGPTAAFKDFGARFLAACLSRLYQGQAKPLTIVVATSGDTGAAVAAAFHNLPNLKVVVLYPDGRVSPRQAHQLGCFGGNIRTLKVAGSFDDCQAMAKQALNDQELQTHVPLSSANSISLGRLLPQMAYYAHTALQYHATHQRALNFIIPTGNLGNAVAAIMARSLGVPLGNIHLATNANRVLPDYFSGQPYQPQPSIATLANAMDVGAPSNFERLHYLYQANDQALRQGFRAFSVDDQTIRATITERYQHYGEIFCPHTATAAHVLQQQRACGAISTDEPWAIAATAHPAKFESIVEPLIETSVPVPPALAELLERPAYAEACPADYAALRARLLS